MATTVDRGGKYGQADFYEWGVRLRGAKWDKWLMPIIDIRYPEIDHVRLMAGPVTRGVRFFSDCVPGPVTMVTSQGPEILDRVEQHGAPVNREPGQFGRQIGI